jgi:hypothetical protein
MDSTGRPEVLSTISDTQLQELDRNFDEGDHEGWMILAQSYGWSDQQCQAVWDWFGQKPQGGEGGMESSGMGNMGGGGGDA